jgi:hypothetical protein
VSGSTQVALISCGAMGIAPGARSTLTPWTSASLSIDQPKPGIFSAEDVASRTARQPKNGRPRAAYGRGVARRDARQLARPSQGVCIDITLLCVRHPALRAPFAATRRRGNLTRGPALPSFHVRAIARLGVSAHCPLPGRRLAAGAIRHWIKREFL